MLPRGFLGTRADILMDLVIVSLVVIVPLLAWSWSRARDADFGAHRKIQIGLFSVLVVAVILFEADIKMSGGIFELTKGSRYDGTAFLKASVYVHTALSILTSLIWVSLIVFSLIAFGNPPKAGRFGTVHRMVGRIGMVGMILTSITGVQLYILGFAM
jgi:uncharacterized membrane protein YozB (DUF420 family)